MPEQDGNDVCLTIDVDTHGERAIEQVILNRTATMCALRLMWIVKRAGWLNR